MSYLDIIKKLNNHSDTTSAMVVQGKNLENMYFTKDPSYRRATLYKHDLTEEYIDIRIKNISKTVSEKKIILRPDTVINVGSLIGFDNKYYIVDEYEGNSTSPYCKTTLCNQFLQLDNDSKIPCVVEGESYGVKIYQANNDFIGETDTKVKITVPRNHVTLRIKPDTRYIFGNSQFGIYKVGDVAMYQDGVLVFIAKKDKYMEGYDDLENNLAYNGTTEEPSPADYTLEGEDEIKINQTYQYKLFPSVGNPMWKLDDYTVMNNLAELSLVDAYTVEIKGLKQGEFIELICEVSGVILKKEIMIVR